MSGLIGIVLEVGILSEVLKKTKKLNDNNSFESLGVKN